MHVIQPTLETLTWILISIHNHIPQKHMSRLHCTQTLQHVHTRKRNTHNRTPQAHCRKLLSSVCNTWTPVLGVKQSDINHITLANSFYLPVDNPPPSHDANVIKQPRCTHPAARGLNLPGSWSTWEGSVQLERASFVWWHDRSPMTPVHRRKQAHTQVLVVELKRQQRARRGGIMRMCVLLCVR